MAFKRVIIRRVGPLFWLLAAKSMQNIPLESISIDHFNDLLPLLLGKVFHVTTCENLLAIKSHGSISHNSGNWTSPFINAGNGYFRNLGSVSFFDYRSHDSAEWQDHYYKCLPTLPLDNSNEMAVLFLKTSEFHKLQSWQDWKVSKAFEFNVVPHVEAGYPNSVKFNSLEKILLVSNVNIKKATK